MSHNSFSERVALLRPLLIFLIVTTHIQGTLYRPDLKDPVFGLASYLHVLLSGVIAVGALPLLSLLSGYLALSTWQKYGYATTLGKKVRRLLLPMLAWNLLLGLYIAQQQATGHGLRPDLQLYPFSALDWVLGLLALFKLPMNPPLYFLRELLLCFVLLPLLVRVARRGWSTALLLAVIAWMSLRGINLYFFHRIDIYGFFLAGLYIARHRQQLSSIGQWLRRPAVQVLILGGFTGCALLLAGYVFLPSHRHFLLASKISTVLSPLAFWLISAHIGGRLKAFLLWLSPASFSVFLGHIAVLTLTFGLWQTLTGSNPLERHYGLYWLVSLTACFVIMGGLHAAWQRLPAGLERLRNARLAVNSPATARPAAPVARAGWQPLGWLLLALLPAVMLWVMAQRAFFIDSIFGKAVNCNGCFNGAVLRSDWPLLALATLLLLAGFTLRRRWLCLPLRLAGLLLALLYTADYLTSRELSSRLLFADLASFLADTAIIQQHLRDTGFLGAAGLLLAGLALLLALALLVWPSLAALRGRTGAVLLGLTLASGCIALAWPKTQYVHNWAIDNLAVVNWQRGETIPYRKRTVRHTLAQPPQPLHCSPGLQRRDDLIILVLESWSVFQSRQFGGIHNWTPELDELAEQGLILDNFHAAGFTTNEGLMGLLAGMEVLATTQPRKPFITAWGGDYHLPGLLARQGYHSSFLTTGNLRFSRKDQWLEHLGFDHIEGHNHPDYDGLPRFHFAAPADEALYRRSLRHLDALEQPAGRPPYAVVIENVSSHHPYKHPHTGSTEQADVFGYMDQAAADFIRQLQARGFFEHGRLLVVSDHRAMLPVDPQEQAQLGLATLSRIPAFWLGKDIAPGRVSQPFHQADLLPTLEHQLAGETCHEQGLRDMLDAAASTPRCVFHGRGDQRQLVNVFCPEGQGTIRLAGERTRFHSASGLSDPRRQALLHWLNRYRIERDDQHSRWLQANPPARQGKYF